MVITEIRTIPHDMHPSRAQEWTEYAGPWGEDADAAAAEWQSDRALSRGRAVCEWWDRFEADGTRVLWIAVLWRSEPWWKGLKPAAKPTEAAA